MPHEAIRDQAAPKTTDAPIIALRDVEMVFPGEGGDVVALSNVSLEVAPREFVSLIGSSGCGKTTLLRLVADLEQPTAGTITIKGKPPEQARLDRDYGFVFQAPVLYQWRTVKRNVQLPLEIMGVSNSEREDRAKRLLDMVGLSDFERSYPWQLSGGMQQRVSIARALSFSPSILLMDEPFGALDEITREQMQLELLRIWRDMKTTTLFVTHSIPEAVFLSTRAVVMSARPGRVHEVIEVDLPQPRTVDTRESERFFELMTTVRESLRQVENGAA
ncbi:MAG: ABC transporter ATP-binding protein [Candidatus Bipolaricaulia bacterium]